MRGLGNPVRGLVGVSVGVHRLAHALVAGVAVGHLGGVGRVALRRTEYQLTLNLGVRERRSADTSFTSFFQRVLSFSVICFETRSRESLQDLMHSASQATKRREPFDRLNVHKTGQWIISIRRNS